MTGTSVLPPPNNSEADHVLDMPLHHKPTPTATAPTPITTTTTATTTTATTTVPEPTMGGLHMIKERDEDDEQQQQQQLEPDAVRQHYENMTYDDLSQRMAENYKQLSAMLGKTSSMSNPESPSSSLSSTDDDDDNDHHHNAFTTANAATTTTTELDNETDIVQHPELDDKTKKHKVTQLFCRAASSGDLQKVTSLLKDYRSYIDIDARDEDGTTPLIYAACFGKMDIAQALLEAGAKTDVQDSYGWSALMWATNNSHEAIVKVLLESGASSHTKSAKGRTVFDFVNTDNQKIVEILATNPRDSISSTSSIMGRNAGSLSSSSSNAGDYDFYYQSTLEGYDNFMAEEADRRRKLLETAMALAGGNVDDTNVDNDDDDQDFDNNEDNGDYGDDDDDQDDDDDDMTHEFHWDKCLPDQMFVFGADNLQYILDAIITNIQLPVRTHQEICVPANVIFLSARFAHYFSSDELLQEVLEGAMSRIGNEIKTNARNVHVLAFWITNATQLLYYLKKDTGLVVATAEHQLRISELISEIYTMIINDTERRLTKILVPAMLDHEQIPGMEDVNFADDWQRFFRRSTRRSVIVPPDGGLAVQMKRNMSTPVSNTSSSSSSSNNNSNGACSGLAISPQSVTSLLTSTLYVLQSYDVHPTIIIQALAQFFHYISCEMFNRILSNKKLLCRSKALQIRMNMSHIEDWIGQSNLPHSLVTYFDPTTQLLQLLQCLTQLQDLVGFIQTVKKFDSLNALQVKRCVTSYRYEVNEQRLPDEIEKYAMQLAEDTVRYKQARSQSRNNKSTTTAAAGGSMSRTQSVSLRRTRSRRDSVSSFVGSLMSSVGITASASLPPTLPSSPTTEEDPNNTTSSNSSTTAETSAATTAASTAATTPAKTSTEEQQQQQLEALTEEPLKLDDDEDKEIKETRDPKFMLPFSVPTTAHMVSFTGWASDEESKRDRERLVTPVIPSEWMDRLDNGTLE
ncbi:hypothetical protein BDB00DRAFT_842351 [Zychaea mexicana]|uniref:uncharacterized protein n=1 Tax=Zychaea mexicana TaxID=64656 RepID=UPI0022FDC37C|nr:uncharacterized protein BDB00DRAFT_842351 [Zychaea mexicana]KAI9489635.1 hypothetical protein BDB00DRAFT_842351 [Zychaea mexicana]